MSNADLIGGIIGLLIIGTVVGIIVRDIIRGKKAHKSKDEEKIAKKKSKKIRKQQIQELVQNATDFVSPDILIQKTRNLTTLGISPIIQDLQSKDTVIKAVGILNDIEYKSYRGKDEYHLQMTHEHFDISVMGYFKEATNEKALLLHKGDAVTIIGMLDNISQYGYIVLDYVQFLFDKEQSETQKDN